MERKRTKLVLPYDEVGTPLYIANKLMLLYEKGNRTLGGCFHILSSWFLFAMRDERLVVMVLVDDKYEVRSIEWLKEKAFKSLPALFYGIHMFFGNVPLVNLFTMYGRDWQSKNIRDVYDRLDTKTTYKRVRFN